MRAPPTKLSKAHRRKKHSSTKPIQGETYVVYTDGSFRPPNFGAWAFAVLKGGKPYNAVVKPVRDTTVNRMELTAILEALRSLPARSKIVILSDSMYAIRCVRDWARGWKLQGWLAPTGLPVKNSDLLDALLAEVDRMYAVNLHHVKAHSGILHNEIVDFLAQAASCQDSLSHDKTIIAQVIGIPNLPAP